MFVIMFWLLTWAKVILWGTAGSAGTAGSTGDVALTMAIVANNANKIDLKMFMFDYLFSCNLSHFMTYLENIVKTCYHF